MKRALIKNTKIIPEANGIAVNREGFLSAIFGVRNAEITGNPDKTFLSISLEQSDEINGEFEPITDKLAQIDGEKPIELEPESIVNFDIDLVGLKKFIKVRALVNFEGGTAPAAAAANYYALALGDSAIVPV